MRKFRGSSPALKAVETFQGIVFLRNEKLRCFFRFVTVVIARWVLWALLPSVSLRVMRFVLGIVIEAFRCESGSFARVCCRKLLIVGFSYLI